MSSSLTSERAMASMLSNSVSSPRPGYMSTDRPEVIAVMSTILERAVKTNQDRPSHVHQQSQSTIFHGLQAPGISIEQYLERVFRYAHCSPSCFVIAHIYLDRIINSRRALPITSLNVHRLLITAIMVAAKFNDDVYFNNAYYARIGGVSIKEMNLLELDFLFRLDFRLHVTPVTFSCCCDHLDHERMLSLLFAKHRSIPFSPSVEVSSSPTIKVVAACAERKALSDMETESCESHTPPRDSESYGRLGLAIESTSVVQ